MPPAGRLAAVSRLHRQQPRMMRLDEPGPDGALHGTGLDPGAELDARRQVADLTTAAASCIASTSRPTRRPRSTPATRSGEQQRPRALVRRRDARHQRPARADGGNVGRLHRASDGRHAEARHDATRRRTCTAGRPTGSGCSSPASATASSTSTRFPSTAATRSASRRRRAWTMARSRRPTASGSTSTRRAPAGCRSGG